MNNKTTEIEIVQMSVIQNRLSFVGLTEHNLDGKICCDNLKEIDDVYLYNFGIN
jgi:hypothetical protein